MPQNGGNTQNRKDANNRSDGSNCRDATSNSWVVSNSKATVTARTPTTAGMLPIEGTIAAAGTPTSVGTPAIVGTTATAEKPTVARHQKDSTGSTAAALTPERKLEVAVAQQQLNASNSRNHSNGRTPATYQCKRKFPKKIFTMSSEV